MWNGTLNILVEGSFPISGNDYLDIWWKTWTLCCILWTWFASGVQSLLIVALWIIYVAQMPYWKQCDQSLSGRQNQTQFELNQARHSECKKWTQISYACKVPKRYRMLTFGRSWTPKAVILPLCSLDPNILPTMSSCIFVPIYQPLQLETRFQLFREQVS